MSQSKVLPVLGTVVGGIAGAIYGGPAGAAAGASIGGGLGVGTTAALAKGAPPPPTPPPVASMPDQDLIGKQRQQTIASLLQQRGRASTILTGFGEGTKLGG